MARRAINKLKGAGYILRVGSLADRRGTALAFEITVEDREEERLALTYARNLARDRSCGERAPGRRRSVRTPADAL